MATRDPFGSVGGFSPWAPFSPADLTACFPVPRWVADRLLDYPQPATAGALKDPLPIPFSAEETRKALLDVWLASHQPLNRNCANIDPASVRIALLVLGILQQRNGGWVNLFSARPPVMTTSAPASGQGVNLKCVLYKLVGKPLPPVYDFCAATPPRPQAIYYVSDVKTAFAPSGGAPAVQPYVSPSPPGVQWDAPGGEGGGSPQQTIGLDFERVEPAAPDPFAYSLFEVSSAFGIKE